MKYTVWLHTISCTQALYNEYEKRKQPLSEQFHNPKEESQKEAKFIFLAQIQTAHYSGSVQALQ